MTEICRYELCNGCGACSAVCPVHAVTLEEKSFEGLRTVIDTDACIDCGKCRKVCPSCTPVQKRTPVMAYAAYAESTSERASSASGGVATVLARHVISEGGAVYGCVQCSAGDIIHMRIDDMKDVSLMKGSKYVHSHTADIFAQIREDLKADRRVFFIGTPCQVAGVRHFVGTDASGLLTADLCCHGVPSQSLLKSHLVDKGYDPASCKVFFRRKDRGEIEYGLGITDGEHQVWNPAYRDTFMAGFLSGLFLRENCFSCAYACPERCGDITLSDCWGVDSDPEMTHRKGLSAVLVNTQTGKELFDASASVLAFRPVEVQKVLGANAQFRHPSVKPSGYESFVEECSKTGFKAVRRYIPSRKRQIFFKQLKSRYYSWPFRQLIRRKLKKTI